MCFICHFQTFMGISVDFLLTALKVKTYHHIIHRPQGTCLVLPCLAMPCCPFSFFQSSNLPPRACVRTCLPRALFSPFFTQLMSHHSMLTSVRSLVQGSFSDSSGWASLSVISSHSVMSSSFIGPLIVTMLPKVAIT